MSMLLTSRDHPDADAIDAVIFDMDGVVTDSAQAHFSAWKVVFDEFLQSRAHGDGEEFNPFTQSDYPRRRDSAL